MSDNGLTKGDWRDVAKGYQAMAREFERQLDEANDATDYWKREAEASARLLKSVDTKLAKLYSEVDAFVDRVVASEAAHRAERELVSANRVGTITYYEGVLQERNDALAELATAYQELYDSHFSLFDTAARLPAMSAYKQALTVLEGGPVDANDSGRSDSYLATEPVGDDDPGLPSYQRVA